MAAIPEGVTLGIAITGAVLGVLNTWRAFDRDRIRLRVVPTLFFASNGESGLCFDIINLSHLPVTLHQVGIELRHPRGHTFAFVPRLTVGGGLPHRMEARTSVTVFMPPGADRDPALREAWRVFAKTACGRAFYGTSPAFRFHIAKLRDTGPTPQAEPSGPTEGSDK